MRLALIVFCFYLSGLEAYVMSKTDNGQDVKWNVRDDKVTLYVDISRDGFNSPSLSDAEIQQIVSASINEWNQASNFQINPQFVSSRPALGTSKTLSFSTNAAFFGSGTLGITSLGYDSKTGEILSADILLNESFFNSIYFTDDPSISSGNDAYLGDVLTHELGHFLGLGHSEAPGSSMVYSVSKDMYTVESDDTKGARKIYGPSAGGVITGQIVGENSIGVFGANVTLISQSTGKIVANELSEADGSFRFEGLDNDHYVIHTAPIKSKENLPSYYTSARDNYCRGSYVPTFFTKCGGRNKGRPQLISITSKNYVNVGNVTIRCDSAHDPSYIYLKNQGFPENYSLRQPGDPYHAGETFYGIFFKDDVENNVANIEDKFEVDLTDIDNSLGNYYLDLKFITESLGSAVELEVSVRRSDQVATIYNITTDGLSNKKELDLAIRHPLSTSSASNFFEIIVTPKALTFNEKIEVFGTTQELISQQYYYSILQGVSERNGLAYTLVSTKDSSYIEDNSQCAEGVVTRSSRAFISSPPANNNGEGGVETKLLSCGTVDFDQNDGPPWGGLGSFFVGFFIIFLPFIRRHIPSILLS